MKKKIAALATTAFLVACGSSSDDYYAVGPAASPLTTVQIKAIDMGSDFNNATKTVCYDRNLNGQCDLLEPVVTSTDNTKLILTNVNTEDLRNVPVVITAETAAKVKTTYTLPAGFTTLSPATKYLNTYLSYDEGFNYQEGSSANSIINSKAEGALVNSINRALVHNQTYATNDRAYTIGLKLLQTDNEGAKIGEQIDEYIAVKSVLDGTYSAYANLTSNITALETYLKGYTVNDADATAPKYVYIPFPGNTTSAAFNATYEAFIFDLYIKKGVNVKKASKEDMDNITKTADAFFGKGKIAPVAKLDDADADKKRADTYTAITAADTYFTRSTNINKNQELLVNVLKNNPLTVYNFALGSNKDGKKITSPTLAQATNYTVIATTFAKPTGLIYTAKSAAVALPSLIAAGATQNLPVIGNDDVIPVVAISPYYTATYSDLSALSVNTVTYSYIRSYNITANPTADATTAKGENLFPRVKKLAALTMPTEVSNAYVIKRAAEGVAIEYSPVIAIAELNSDDNKNKDTTLVDLDKLFVGAPSNVVYGKAVYDSAAGTYQLKTRNITDTAVPLDFATIYTKVDADKKLFTNGTFTYLPNSTNTTDPVESFYNNSVALPKEGKYADSGSGKNLIRTFKTYRNITSTVEAQDSLFVLQIFNRNMFDADKTEDLVFILSEVKNPAPLIGFDANAATAIVKEFAK